jgi:hypothetical protein
MVGRSIVNPQRFNNTLAAMLGGSQGTDFLGAMTPGADKNLGVGTEGMIGDLFGMPSGQALFGPGDKAVYESMSDEELHKLEAMDPEQQRQWLNKRRQEVGAR